MNRIILVGRLTRDPEVRYSNNENHTAVARYSIAVERKFKREGDPDADFFNCVSFGKQGEFVEKYLHKGTKVAISGRLQNNNYRNNDGQMVYSVQIAVDDIEFCESKSSQQESNPGSPQQMSMVDDGFMQIPDGLDEQVPFN